MDCSGAMFFGVIAFFAGGALLLPGVDGGTRASALMVAILFLAAAWSVRTPSTRASGNPKPRKYPRVVGHDGVWCEGYHDIQGNWVPAGFEFTVVETSERTFALWDTQESQKQGVLDETGEVVS